MIERSYTRKLTAILSADAVRYSRFMGEDEADTVRTLTSYRSQGRLVFAEVPTR